jgi:serine O-acetyltransferase
MHDDDGIISDGHRAAVVRSVLDDPRSHRTSATPVPDPEVARRIVERMRWLAFPGFFGPRVAGVGDLEGSLNRTLDDLLELLRPQLAIAFAYEPLDGAGCPAVEASRRADEAAVRFIEGIPAVRSLLAGDAVAGFEGDPAVVHPDEAILVHPGLAATIVHRFAHELHLAGVPLLPRLLSEIAHADTGIDIHPGARIGGSFFIDHGTGVVIGETTRIGERCRIYQGVTLGASRFETEPDGRLRRGYQRHPTLEDDVIVYAGATILGGDTVVGRGSIVNGGVFLTQSVPPGSIVAGPSLEIRLRSK